MAFGKPAEGLKKAKNETAEDIYWRITLARENRALANWNTRWSWVLKEYRELSDKTAEISKRSNFLSEVNKSNKEPDLRRTEPIPLNTNGLYGWIANKPGFRLEKYGADVHIPLDMPKDLYLVY